MIPSKKERENPLSQQILCTPGHCIIFDNPLRRLVQNPEKILKPYIKPGMTILDVGPGMGYYTITLAKLTGETGKVIAADLQKAMLEGIRRRAEKAGVVNRIVFHQAQTDKIGVTEPIDFCLAFWMVHEVPDRERFLGEIYTLLKPGGLFLFAEPRIHTPLESFNASVEIALKAGFKLVERPKIFLSNSALMTK